MYALIATGYSLVFSMVGIINLAYGAILTIGVLLAYEISVQLNLGVVVGFLVSMFVCGLLGWLTDVTTVEPVRRQRLPMYFALLSTFGLNVVLQTVAENVTLQAWRAEFRPFPPPFAIAEYILGGVRISSLDLAVISVVLVTMIGIHFFMTRTWGGRAVAITASDPEVAEVMGVNTRKVIAYTFFASCALASLAGTIMGMYYGVASSNLGTAPGLKGFIAALIGGGGHITGAVLGALILGMIESLAAGFIGSSYRDLVAFVALVVMFLIRPTGILGGSPTR
jgi:branched-chain amino acid transport system permease protein